MPCECSLDLPRTVKIERGSQAPIWYEYVEAPCIQMAYPEPGSMSTVKEIGTSGHGNKAMCADNRLPVAATICCDSDANPVTICTSVGERTTYQTTVDRCANYLTGYSTCAWDTAPINWDCGTGDAYWQGGKYCKCYLILYNFCTGVPTHSLHFSFLQIIRFTHLLVSGLPGHLLPVQ